DRALRGVYVPGPTLQRHLRLHRSAIGPALDGPQSPRYSRGSPCIVSIPKVRVPVMKRMIGRLGVLLSAALLTGCVERRFVIESVPPTAQVLRNGQPIGFTPVDSEFIYYGKYNFTLIKDGYETLHVT